MQRYRKTNKTKRYYPQEKIEDMISDKILITTPNDFRSQKQKTLGIDEIQKLNETF